MRQRKPKNKNETIKANSWVKKVMYQRAGYENTTIHASKQASPGNKNKKTRKISETTQSTSDARRSKRLLLRGTIVNRTKGTDKNLPGIYLTIFTNNIWSCQLWTPVVLI